MLGHESFYTFRTRYAILKTMNFGSHSAKVPVGYKNLDELSEIISNFSDRVLKEDCLDLPPYTHQKRIIQLIVFFLRLIEHFLNIIVFLKMKVKF